MRKLNAGDVEIVQGRGGWLYKLTGTATGADIRIYNPAGDGDKEKFFAVDTAGNPYGAPMIIQEPSLGIPCRNAGVNVDGHIVGALVTDGSEKIVERFSWSNLVYIKGGSFNISSDGELTVNGERKGYLSLIFLADKNRIQGYVGVFVPQKPVGCAKVIEMEDLLLSQL